MKERKESLTFYFSVEGQTEEWYLDWLQKLINDFPDKDFNVIFKKKRKKDPISMVKGLSIVGPTTIYHLFDYESKDKVHQDAFFDVMRKMKETKKIGKQIKYVSGYTNFSFDLWIALHKIDCNKTFDHRKQYIELINKAFNKKYEDMKEYKREANFHDCLSQIGIEEVIAAIKRSKKIMAGNIDKGYKLQEYCGYVYYDENPSLMLGEVISEIFDAIGIKR